MMVPSLPNQQTVLEIKQMLIKTRKEYMNIYIYTDKTSLKADRGACIEALNAS